jgi:hypothetical protein
VSVEQARAELARRLWARREELEQATLARVYGVSDPLGSAAPDYLEGLRVAVGAALDYALAAVELGEKRSAQIPTVLLAQARLAARVGIGLDTVLRRYFGGFTLFGDFLLQEIETGPALDCAPLRRQLGSQNAQFDRLIAAVAEEFAHAREEAPGSPLQRRAERVKRLLAGELLDVSELDYDFDGHHVGLVATGPEALAAVRGLAVALEQRALIVPAEAETVWAWLGARRPLDPAEICEFLSRQWPAGVSLTVGECGRKLPGWRFTHRQAAAALPIALSGPSSCVRYAEVTLLASMLRDDLLAASLQQLYLAPLAAERDGGLALRETLRAYFTAEGNVTSAAAALGVNRHTVSNRLQTIEERLNRPLRSCATELDAALQLEDLGHRVLPYPAFAKG